MTNHEEHPSGNRAIQLGNLPRTRKFQPVVEPLDAEAGTPQIVAATLDAAKRGLP